MPVPHPGSPPEARESLALFCFTAAIVLSAECLFLVLFHRTQDFTLPGLMHLLMMSILLAGICFMPQKQTRRFTILLLLLTAVTGPYGAAIALVDAIAFVRRTEMSD